MFIQGHLQVVFDALYNLGMIDPVLKMDWQTEYQKLRQNPAPLNQAIQLVNGCQGDIHKLVHRLKDCDESSLRYLAMEVAREFADFYANSNLH
jgi:hypothetical protein